MAALALHSHRRDLALFHRSYVSIKTRGLLWYYGRLQRELIKDFFKSAYEYGAITQLTQLATEKQRQIEELSARFDEAEDKPAMTRQAFELYKELVGIQAALERMTNG